MLCRDEALVKALSAIGMSVATGPATVHRILLQRNGSQAALLTPSFLRDFIRAHASQAAKALSAERGHAAAVLSYCLQDIEDSDAESCSALRGRTLPYCLQQHALVLVALACCHRDVLFESE